MITSSVYSVGRRWLQLNRSKGILTFLKVWQVQKLVPQKTPKACSEKSRGEGKSK